MTPLHSISFMPDTSILVHFARNDALAQSIEQEYALLKPSDLHSVSVVTMGEIRALAALRDWGDTKWQRVDELLARCQVIWIDTEEILNAYAELNIFSIRAGRPIGDNDLWIAAAARVTGATLLTTDKDFDHLYPNYILLQWIDQHLP